MTLMQHEQPHAMKPWSSQRSFCADAGGGLELCAYRVRVLVELRWSSDIPRSTLSFIVAKRKNLRVKKFNRLVATAASYCSTTLKFSKLFRVTPSFTKVCTGRLHSWVCDCIHLQQQEFKDSDRCGPEVVNFRLVDIGDLKKSQQLWISQLFTHFQIFYFKLQDKQKYWVLVYINSYTTYTKLHMKNKRD